MPKSPEQYQPTKEDVKKAEDIMTEEEKQMSAQRFEQKEKENIKEMQRHAPLLFVYRDNTLFKKYVPIILKNLAEMGRQVDVMIFPEDTQREDIHKWYEENKELLSKKAIVSDVTAGIPYEMQDEVRYELGAREVESVDRLINKVLQKILFGDSIDEDGIEDPRGDGNVETSKRFITTVVKNILKNPNQHPEKVLILSSNMGDHIGEFDAEFDAEETSKMRNDFDFRYTKDTKEACEYVTAKVKEWLVESGLESEQIEVITDTIPNRSREELEEFLEKLDQPNTWVITDRHTSIGSRESDRRRMRSAIVLKMPLGNFYEEAREQGILCSSEEEFEKEWKNLLKNEFGN